MRTGEYSETRRYLPDAIQTQYRGGAVHTRYLHKDHLGSIDSITDESGKLVEKLYFDAWGKKQSIDRGQWSVNEAFVGLSLGNILDITPRGFTGHEHVDHADIIHMNGRIYDPSLGRFLQADPHIQAPKNSQSLNRYSYVLNNPLSYTDPSGYFFKALGNFVKKYWKVIAAVVVSYFTFGAASGWAASWALGSGFSASAAGFIGAVAGGAAAGFASGAIITGSLKGALKGAFTGAITAGVFEGVAQFGFDTSTVQGIEGALQLEKAGVSQETIAKLYGNTGSGRAISKEEYQNAVSKGSGKFTEQEITQIQDALSTTQANANKRFLQNKLNRDSENIVTNFGSTKHSGTVLGKTNDILQLANKANLNTFVNVGNGFCGGAAMACVVPNLGNNVFLEPSFFDPKYYAASLGQPAFTQAHVLTHEFAHLAYMNHTLKVFTTNQIVLNGINLTRTQASNAIYNAESYAWYINGH